MQRAELLRALLKAAAAVAVGSCLAACSMHGRNSVSFLLEQEKTQLRDSIAQKIGANPEDITRAMDTSQAGEIANARRIKRETLARYGRSKDKAMEAQLQKVANRLSLAFVGSGGMKYEVVLVKNETMNAFTPGGGIIVINEGLLMFCDTEGEVAAVMAHEMGHVLRRDPLKQRQMSLVRKAGRSITAAITPQSMDKSLGNALRLGGGASMNASTRVQEAEADSLGIDIMVAAGYDPREMVHVQETFMLYAPQESRLANVLYGNHPLSKDRADAARRKIAKQYPDVGGDVTTAAYDALAKRYQERRMAQIARKL